MTGIEERAFEKAKKRAWEHLDGLGIDLDGMFRYTNVDAVNLMFNLVLEGRKEWLNEAENVEADGDKTEISAAEILWMEKVGTRFLSQLVFLFAGPLWPASAETGARIIHTLLE